MEPAHLFGISIEAVTAISNCIMALGALLIFLQIRQSKLQAKTEFEDGLNSEYRRIIHAIPARALLGKTLPKKQMNQCLDELLSYIDLCNEQAFLRQQNRIRSDTWHFWADGMKSNFSRPAFRQAWQIITTKLPSDFNELRRLDESDFQDDPATWN